MCDYRVSSLALAKSLTTKVDNGFLSRVKCICCFYYERYCMEVKVLIIPCFRFAELRNMICKSIRNEIVVRGIQKGRTEFEVFINGQLAFSKLKEGHFPDLDLILEEIEHAANDSDYKINYITETESFCTCRYTSCCQIR